VDLSDGQIHSCKLKRVAFERLNIEALFDFLMNRDYNSTTAAERAAREKTFAELVPHLPADTVAFFKAPERYEQFMKTGLYSFGFRQRDIVNVSHALRQAKLHPYENKENVLQEANKSQWDEIFRNNLMPQLPQQRVGPRIGGFIRESLRLGTSDLWFFRSFFGRPHPSHLPPFMAMRHQFPTHKSESRLDTSKLVFECREFSDAIETATKAGQVFHLIDGSNVLDALSVELRHKILTAIANALPVGGITVFRTGPMDVYEMPDLRALIARYLTVDGALSDEMLALERCRIYRNVCVARKTASTSIQAPATPVKTT